MSLSQKTKNRGNNVVSRRFDRLPFYHIKLLRIVPYKPLLSVISSCKLFFWKQTIRNLNAYFIQQGQVGAKLVHSLVAEQSMCQIVNNGLIKVQFLAKWEKMGQWQIIQRTGKWQKLPCNNCKKGGLRTRIQLEYNATSVLFHF